MSSELENRIRILEEKHEYQDHTVEALNQVLIRQQAQIDALQEELIKLRKDMLPTNVEAGDVAHDPPPHY